MQFEGNSTMVWNKETASLANLSFSTGLAMILEQINGCIIAANSATIV
jgi:hypothetical protein